MGTPSICMIYVDRLGGYSYHPSQNMKSLTIILNNQINIISAKQMCIGSNRYKVFNCSTPFSNFGTCKQIGVLGIQEWLSGGLASPQILKFNQTCEQIKYILFIIQSMAQSQEQRNMGGLLQQKKMFADICEYDKRSCTDCCCIIIGLLFSIVLFTVAAVSANQTHENQISLPSDSSGKVCGIDYKKYSFIYFTNPPDITSRVCVSSCPKPGAAQLDCVTSGKIGCKFNQIPGFTVSYYDSEAVMDSNGNYCLPTDPVLREKVTDAAKLDSRLVFFNSFDVLVLCLAIAVGLSILFTILMHCFARSMVWITIISSMVVLLGLAVVLFIYKTDNIAKIIIGIILVLLFLIVAISIWIYRKQITLSGIFLDEGTKFTANKPSTIFYIILFMALSLGLFVVVIFEYNGLIGVGAPTFDKSQLYYAVNNHGLWVTLVLLGIQLIWGIFFLKESFNFCLSTHAVLYYLKKGGGLCSITDALSLLVFKHLGSVIASAFMNFFFIPDLIADLFRNDTSSNEQHYSESCFRFFDLVRTDAMAYVSLTGNPFCQSSKYCEYFTHVSMLHDGDQSALRLYRICAHILISGAVSILGLYIKGNIQPYTIAATLIIGMFVSTYIISYQADPAQALMLMYSIDEEFYRRYPKKGAHNPADKKEQQKYLGWLEGDYSRKSDITSGFAKDIKQLKIEQWNENVEPSS